MRDTRGTHNLDFHRFCVAKIREFKFGNAHASSESGTRKAYTGYHISRMTDKMSSRHMVDGGIIAPLR